MRRLIVAVVVLAVIVVMALRGCPRVRRSAGMAHAPEMAGLTCIAKTAFLKPAARCYTDFTQQTFFAALSLLHGRIQP